MKEENYLEGIYGCLERIEKKVETLPVEGTSPAVENRTNSPEGIAELKIRLERLQSAVEKNSSEIAAVRSHTARLSEGWPLSAETFAGEMEKTRDSLRQDSQAVKETVRRLDERMVLLKKEPVHKLVTYRLESASKAVVTTAAALILALVVSVWTKFRSSSVEGREGTLYFQIIHGRVARQINTGYRLFPSEWDGRTSEIILPVSGDSRRSLLLALKERMEKDIRRLESIIAGLERSGGTYPAGRVVELFHNPPPEDSHNFMAFGKRLVEELERVGKKRTAERYTTVLNSFTHFRGRDGDIPLEDIGSTLMLEYEAWLKDKGICPNSTSYYMRNLRAVYNRAVDRELTVQRSPFKHVYTGIDKTVKRAVPLKAVRMIRDLDLRLSPGMEYARDMFMLSFYTRGMSFVDIAYLKKADLKSGVLTYRRRKTGRRLSIKWEKPMQEILDRYGHNDSPYLFPVIRDTAKDAVRQYRSAAHFINGKLKELGKRLGLGMPLTMYVARHAWASIARSKNVPLATISEAMGHDSENTTRIYLASLDTSQVDKANDIILKSL